MGITQYIGSQFGKPTGIGGRISTFVMNRMNQRQYGGTAESLQLSKGETVLDIGFGNGYLLNKLAEKTSCKFYGIEISDDMLRIAAKRNHKYIKDGKMILSEGNVDDLKFSDSYFDKVYTVNTVYFWSDINRGLSEIMRVLKPGGIFVNAVYSKEFLESFRYTQYGFIKYTVKDLEDIAVQSGFEVEIVTLKQGKAYCFILRKPTHL